MGIFFLFETVSLGLDLACFAWHIIATSDLSDCLREKVNTLFSNITAKDVIKALCYNFCLLYSNLKFLGGRGKGWM